MDYAFFQEYWWLLVSVLGALLVFLLFVQGGQSLFFSIGKEQLERKLLVNSVGRKWEFTFLLPTLLLDQLWGSLLGMDAHSLLLHYSGCLL